MSDPILISSFVVFIGLVAAIVFYSRALGSLYRDRPLLFAGYDIWAVGARTLRRLSARAEEPPMRQRLRHAAGLHRLVVVLLVTYLCLFFLRTVLR